MEPTQEQTNDEITKVVQIAVDVLKDLGVQTIVIGLENAEGMMSRSLIGAHFRIAGIIETLRFESRCNIIGDINAMNKKEEESNGDQRLADQSMGTEDGSGEPEG